MNLNNLKDAWAYLKIRNSMYTMAADEILYIIEREDDRISLGKRMLMDALIGMFLLLLTQSS